MENAGMRYWEALKSVLESTVISQIAAIQQAAEVVARALAAGRRLYIYDTGHMLNRELVNRAGGLVAMTPLQFELTLDNTIAEEPERERPKSTEEEIRGYVNYALTQADIQRGDVVIIGSVTGSRVFLVEVALQMKSRGIALIGLTSKEYSAFAPVQHSAGKKLSDICDVLIDNGCVVGDAMLSIHGLDVPVGPASGISAATLMWMLCAEIVERQIALGKMPLVLESMNLPGAMDRNRDKALQYLAGLNGQL